MGQGQPIDFMKPLEKTFSDVIKVASQVVTGGLAEYDPMTGQTTKGVTTRLADETLGEITGRNLAREKSYEAGQALKSEAAAKKLETEQELAKKRLQDITASQQAGAIKEEARAKAQSTVGVSGYQGPTTDFLGL